MLAWGTWSYSNPQSHRNKEWNKCVEGVNNKEEKKKIRMELVNSIWSDEKNQGNQKNVKQRRKGYQHKEKRKIQCKGEKVRKEKAHVK